jgi:hypothetical protein
MSVPTLESASAWAGGIALWLTVAAAAAGIFAWYFSSRLAEAKEAAAKAAQMDAEKSLLTLQNLIQVRRRLDRDETQKVLRSGTTKGSVAILYADGNEEAYSLALDLGVLFRGEGWTVDLPPKPGSGTRPVVGVVVEFAGDGFPVAQRGWEGMLPEPAKTIYQALVASRPHIGRVYVETQGDPALGDGVRILVGTKFIPEPSRSSLLH